mmetsp:Transcript_19595/g.51977  ORF Transcript_19595/g.51977 Transcript_19595/m.51977 type:complete len:575 (+) Transcript_19595:103-1827(+)
MALRWRNGFIEEVGSCDGEDEDEQPKARARARSDPRSECDSIKSETFHRERQYVEGLNVSIDNLRSAMSTGARSENRSESGVEHAGSSLPPRVSSARSQDVKGALDKDLASPRPHPSRKEEDSAATNMMSEAVRQQVQRNLSKAKTQKTKHLTMALAAIEEITVQVTDCLHRSGNSFAEDVQDTIGELRTRMRDEDGTVAADAAIESLDVIPEMIVQSFEASAHVAKKTLQEKVDVVLRGIAEMSLDDDDLVAQMRLIPAEVEDITKRAVADALNASQLQASLQVNFAKVSLPDWQWTLTQVNNRINTSVPGMGTLTVQVATSQAVETMEKAVEAVKQNDQQSFSSATNEVVADTLLRAKADDPGGPSGEGGAGIFVNPGSVGHPELCTRPCLYFTTGSCNNGTTCEFCHLPHPKRPAHLDKRNREMLKAMPLSDCVALVLPILQAKVDELDLGPDMMMLVNQVGEAAQVGSTPSGRKNTTGSKDKASLLTALKAMSLRSLLMMLNRSSVLSPSHPQNTAIDAVWQHLRLRSHFLTAGKESFAQGPGYDSPPMIPGLTPTPISDAMNTFDLSSK